MSSDKKKLVFLDIDGTILAGNGKMSPKVKLAIRQAKENGHYLCISSGRAWTEIPDKLKDFDGIVSAAGACITWKGQILLAEYLSEEEKEIVSGTLEEADAIYIMEGYDHSYMKTAKKERILKIMEHYDEREKEAFQYFNGTIPCDVLSEMKKIHKCSFFYAGKEGSWIQERLAPFGMNVDAFSQGETRGNSGEIAKKAFNKGSAVLFLSDYLGVAIEDTIAIGDSENDMKMLKAAGIGIAMGNALDNVKEAADDITGTLEEDGVYESFLKYGLIDA